MSTLSRDESFSTVCPLAKLPPGSPSISCDDCNVDITDNSLSVDLCE